MIQDHTPPRPLPEPIPQVQEIALESVPVPLSVPKPVRVSGGCEAIRAKLSALGVSGSELDAAIELSMREASCNEFAINKSSGACGAYQSLKCGKWGSPGTTEYYQGAINYCRSRYGGFAQALSFQKNNGWY